jgi:two-component system NtrC family response regulator
MTRILLVEDDANLRRVLAYHLERAGHSVVQAMDGVSALDRFREDPVDLVLTDVRMPGMDGIELLKAFRQMKPELPVVVMTAYGTIGDAVEAMRQGAADYLTKPVEKETLLLAVQKAGRVLSLERENRRLKEDLMDKRPVEAMLGTSAAMQDVLETIRRVAPTDATVLVTGESGTGKELAARALHSLSSRADERFVPINCAALPRDLLESELFGHVKGAFTGASETKPGKFQQANGGSLFLDEIGDMDVGLQAKILRALQERVVDPVGSKKPVSVDVRLIAATHQDLSESVHEGRFREDLYWRLNVIPVRMPPLRERQEDIPILLGHFYRRYGGGELRYEGEARALLEAYKWPGNVRQLQNLCQRLAVLYPGKPISGAMLPPELRKTPPPEAESGGGEAASKRGGLWDMERDAILKALKDNGGNQSAAARSLQIPRHILLYRIKKYGISDE